MNRWTVGYEGFAPLGPRSSQTVYHRRAGYLRRLSRADPEDRHGVPAGLRRKPVPHRPARRRSGSGWRRPSSRWRRSNGCCGTNIPADELETIVSSTGVLAQGRSSLFNPNTGPHTSVISVYLVSPDKRTRNQVQIMNEVRPKIVKLFPGVAMFFDPGGLVKRVTSFGSQKSVDVEIYGYDFEKAREVIRQVEGLMHKIDGSGRHRSQPGGELSRSQRRGGSRESRAARHQRNGRRQRRALFTQRQRPDRSDHLYRPAKRERVLHQRLAGGRAPEGPDRHREHHPDRDETASRCCSRTSRRSN